MPKLLLYKYVHAVFSQVIGYVAIVAYKKFLKTDISATIVTML